MAKGPHDATPPPSDALVRRDDAALAALPERTVLVELSPAQIVEQIRSQAGLRERWLDEEAPLTFSYHQGTTFFEPHADRIVLWRRPDRRRFRGTRERIPYPDVLELRLRPAPRGTWVEMRLRPHPLTLDAKRVQLGLLAVVIAMGIAAWTWMGPSAGLLTLATCVAWLYEPIRFARVRQLGRALLPTAYAWLAPHELSPGDAEASAFRVRAGSALPPVPKPSEPTPPSSEPEPHDDH